MWHDQFQSAQAHMPHLWARHAGIGCENNNPRAAVRRMFFGTTKENRERFGELTLLCTTERHALPERATACVNAAYTAQHVQAGRGIEDWHGQGTLRLCWLCWRVFDAHQRLQRAQDHATQALPSPAKLTAHDALRSDCAGPHETTNIHVTVAMYISEILLMKTLEFSGYIPRRRSP
jgi:hypothetical protein